MRLWCQIGVTFLRFAFVFFTGNVCIKLVKTNIENSFYYSEILS